MGQLRRMRVTGFLIQRFSARATIAVAIAAGFLGLGVYDVQGEDAPRKRVAKRSSDTSTQTDAATSEHPLTKPLKIVRQSRKALEGINDYTATFSKRERLGRGGRKLLAQTMKMKFREQPFSVYFYFQSKDAAGREVIYVNGRNRNQLMVHEGGGIASLVGTLSFAPTAGDVMKENRYPITKVGLKNMVDKIIAQWEGESKYREASVKYYNSAKLGSRECMAIECSHPQPRRQFSYHMTRVYIDKQSKLLVRVEQYGWPTRAGQQPPIIEEYTYSDIKTNVGLRDADFDHRNPQYKF